MTQQPRNAGVQNCNAPRHRGWGLRLGIYLTAEQINPKSARDKREMKQRTTTTWGMACCMHGACSAVREGGGGVSEFVVVVALRRGLGQMKLKCEAG